MCGEHGAVVVELDCSKIPRDQLSRLEHQSGGLSSGFLFQLDLMQSRYVEHP